MSRLLDRVWPAAPAERLGAVRLLVGIFAQIYFSIRLVHIIGLTALPDRQFAPIGVLWWLDSPPPPSVVVAGLAATWLSGIGFLAGWRFRITGPLHALLLLTALTFSNSWGQIFHTENLMVLFVLVLAVTRAADAYSIDARRIPDPPAPHMRYGWPLALLCVLAVASYFIAGVAKLRWGGPGWAGGDVLRHTIAADNLRKIVLGSQHSPVAEILLSQAWLFRGLAVLTLVVEVGAPLALLGRRAAQVWIAAVIGFHIGVVALMSILFPFAMSGVAFAPFFRAERFVEWVRARWRRISWSRASRSAAG